MAQPYVHGGTHVWVGLGGGNGGTATAAYLGTGDKAPRVRIEKKWKDLPNDLGGDVAFDRAYMGRSALVSVRLTRWNEPVMLALEGITATTAGSDLGGFDIAGDIGTLMITEGFAVPLWIMYSYGSAGLSPQTAYATMRSGWHFLAAILVGPDEHEGGTDYATEGISFECLRTYNAATGQFTLFDRSMAGLPGIN